MLTTDMEMADLYPSLGFFCIVASTDASAEQSAPGLMRPPSTEIRCP
jgi:hypothetical protein